ncbi:protein piccolo [Carica papaya]|uniref:protein piccolo n=1 Tax=Carica papaya TaxID=3649 RepID=UPI000B8D1A90|nr:protein piccolo [Carica papaya]
MNTSHFMDKQIMDLSSSSLSSSSHNGKDFIDLMNLPQEENHQRQRSGVIDDGAGDNGFDSQKEEIMPSYDFQPIRPISGLSQSATNLAGSVNSPRVWNSADSKPNSASPNYGSLDSIEPAKLILEKDRSVSDTAIVSEIDRVMKKHTDNLLHAMEGVSARLTQLETRTRNLEVSVDDLKVSVGNNYGSTDGKMRQMENILREVQTGVQVLKDKQNIVEAQFQLARLHVTKLDQQPETESTTQIDSVQPAASAPLQSHQQLPSPPSFPQSHPPVPPPAPMILPPALHQQNLPTPVQHPSQFPQGQVPPVPQREPYFPPPGQAQEASNQQQYQLPPTQQSLPSAVAPSHPTPAAPPHPGPAAPPHPGPAAPPNLGPAAPPHQPYNLGPQPQYSQPPQQPQLQPPMGHHPEDAPYIPSQNYPPSLRQPPSQPPSGPTPTQQYYGAPPHVYESQSSRSNSGFPTGYSSQPGPSEPFPYGGAHPQFGSNPTMKPQQLASPALPQSSGSGYPQLPTARILPHALSTASGVGGGGSSGSGNRVPLDDVIDKVTSMGFPRDHVRATVRNITGILTLLLCFADWNIGPSAPLNFSDSGMNVK